MRRFGKRAQSSDDTQREKVKPTLDRAAVDIRRLRSARLIREKRMDIIESNEQ